MDAERFAPALKGAISPQRSRKSLEFESFWRSLPRDGVLPHRRDFNPARAAKLLRYVMLLEARLEPAVSIPVRLIGSAIEENMQRSIKGHDYLELLDPDRHADAIASLKLMLGRPCGLWQVHPFHYERGTAQNVEATVFPLLGDPVPFLLALVVPRSEFVRPLSPGDRAVLAGGATEFVFIDIGAGVPVWPPA